MHIFKIILSNFDVIVQVHFFSEDQKLYQLKEKHKILRTNSELTHSSKIILQVFMEMENRLLSRKE